jgi:hypothetical protein
MVHTVANVIVVIQAPFLVQPPLLATQMLTRVVQAPAVLHVPLNSRLCVYRISTDKQQALV